MFHIYQDYYFINMNQSEEIIPVIWQKPNSNLNMHDQGMINVLLDSFIKRYRKRLPMRQIIIDLEMPKNAAGFSDKTFYVKLHIQLREGRFLRAESSKRNINEAMKDVIRKIDNQSRSTDRQKHIDTSRQQGE